MINKCRTIRNLPMPQAVIQYVHDWANHSVRKEHLNKMVSLGRNKERYDWDHSDFDEDAGTAEVNPSPLNELPA